MDSRLKVGRKGEDLAAAYLSDKGYTILERNLRNPYGEIDLIALDGEVTVFVEIKTRRSERFGLPEQSVTRRKRERILSVAQGFLIEHPERSENWRVDVVAIQLDRRTGSASILHFEHALR